MQIRLSAYALISRTSTYTLFFLFLFVSVAAAAQDNNLEAKVKAAYLYHLTKFVDWPIFPANEFHICIFGSTAVGSMMSSDLSGRQVRDRPLKIEMDPVANLSACQVLFIGRGDKRLPEVLRRVHGAAVLTVSDMDDFTRQGGIVGFYFEEGKIKLEINPEAARSANIRISAKLMELARIVSKP